MIKKSKPERILSPEERSKAKSTGGPLDFKDLPPGVRPGKDSFMCKKCGLPLLQNVNAAEMPPCRVSCPCGAVHWLP
jgi:hypothetical protein